MVFGMWMARSGWPALPRFLGDDAHRVGGIVAADVEERIDVVRLQDLEDLLAILAGRACRAWSPAPTAGVAATSFQVVGGFLRQIDEVFVDDAAHAMQRAIHVADVAELARLQHHARPATG